MRQTITTITWIGSFLVLMVWLFHGPFLNPSHHAPPPASAAIMDMVGMDDGSAYALDMDKVMYIRDGLSQPVSGISGVVSITKAGPNTAYAYGVESVWSIKDGYATLIEPGRHELHSN